MEEALNPLVAACYGEDINQVSFLLESGIDVNDISLDLFPLLVACGTGNAKIVKLLLDHGAEVDMQNPVGLTSLIVASQEGNANIVRILLDCGANIGRSRC